MWAARRLPVGCVGLAIAAIGILCESTRAHAQLEPVIRAQIGVVEFRVPKEFVNHWVKSRQLLAVAFSYPEIEPVGRFRFGDGNLQQWAEYQLELIKRGGNILNVTLAPFHNPNLLFHNPKPLPADVEIDRIMGAVCAAAGNAEFESYSEYEVEFFRCRRGDNVVFHRGYHRQSGLTFSWEVHTDEWSVDTGNLNELVLTTVRLRKEHLKDWKAINARAHATIDSWKK